jgi:hypothetical protein
MHINHNIYFGTGTLASYLAQEAFALFGSDHFRHGHTALLLNSQNPPIGFLGLMCWLVGSYQYLQNAQILVCFTFAVDI